MHPLIYTAIAFFTPILHPVLRLFSIIFATKRYDHMEEETNSQETVRLKRRKGITINLEIQKKPMDIPYTCGLRKMANISVSNPPWNLSARQTGIIPTKESGLPSRTLKVGRKSWTTYIIRQSVSSKNWKTKVLLVLTRLSNSSAMVLSPNLS